jgi:hypothetical protein
LIDALATQLPIAPVVGIGLTGAVGAVGGVVGGAVSGAVGAVGGGVGGAVSGATSSVVGAGAGAVFDAASSWVASGAVWLLGQVGHLMSETTSVGLDTGWFSDRESSMALIAAAVMLPIACVGAIQAVYRQSASVLARSFLVNLPLAVLLTGAAVQLVRLALSITDALSTAILGAGGTDTAQIFQPVAAFLGTTSLVSPGAPAFVVFAAALVVAVCGFTLWLELAIRAAAVAAATLFLPLALATLVWPAISHWCRRLAETIAALVLSKFVVAAVLSLAAGALAGGTSSQGSGGGVAAVVTGIALLLIATLSPFTLLKLVPAVEAGAVAHLESVRHRVTGAATAALTTADLAVGSLVAGPEMDVGSLLGGVGSSGGDLHGEETDPHANEPARTGQSIAAVDAGEHAAHDQFGADYACGDPGSPIARFGHR